MLAHWARVCDRFVSPPIGEDEDRGVARPYFERTYCDRICRLRYGDLAGWIRDLVFAAQHGSPETRDLIQRAMEYQYRACPPGSSWPIETTNILTAAEIELVHEMPRSELVEHAQRLGVSEKRSNVEMVSAILAGAQSTPPLADEYPVPFCPDDYAVVLSGEDREVPRVVNRHSGAEMTPWSNDTTDRYKSSVTWCCGQLSPPPHGHTCDHIDGDRSNETMSTVGTPKMGLSARRVNVHSRRNGRCDGYAR